ncbi:MAG TPA: PIG-L family deacetylase [Clostridiales bacterium]|nr:PIG-L family deacetylase [Clostridiales bacterium]
MQFKQEKSAIFVPDHQPAEQALRRTTHLAIAAHQDDLEIMSYHGILQCYGHDDRWYTAVVVTDGSGSPRSGLYAAYTDQAMQVVRRLEQDKAATIGEYGAIVHLAYPSSDVKDPANPDVVNDLVNLITQAHPEIVYTHNLADKHETHIAVSLRVIAAIRQLPAVDRPARLYGCEVWRDLDWLSDDEKVRFDVSDHPNLAAALLGVFDSQIAGGKRYDLAAVGRRLANATFSQSHGVDESPAVSFAMDLTPLIQDDTLEITGYITDSIRRFQEQVTAAIRRFQ